MKRKLRYISILVIMMIVVNLLPVRAVVKEEPVNVYTGMESAGATIKNIHFTDVEAQGESYWARKAIYDMAALSVIKGYGERTFNADAPVSKLQALALIYRAVGKEEEAQQAAEVIENLRFEDERRVNAVEVWADGYIQLALNDGLITYEQYLDAITYDQEGLDPEVNFIKTDPAQRQEVGEWIAKALELTPVYNQQTIFNSFQDWKQVDPLKVPYMEAVLKEKIMNGSPDGFLYPNNSISRAEMAQVLKNAEKFILERQGLTEKYGYIEAVDQNVVQQMDHTIVTSLFKVRNAQGELDHILAQKVQDAQGNMIETTHDTAEGQHKEIIVLGKGAPGDSSLLKEGNEIRYVVDDNNQVRFVRVTGYGLNEVVETGDIIEVDYDQYRITVSTEEGDTVTYQVSRNAAITINGKAASFSDVLSEVPVELTLVNNLVVKLEVRARDGAVNENEVTGIVEDINPSLGYISLYDETGKKSFNLLRIYNFLNPSMVEVIRNGSPATIYDVQPGDSVFLKLDEDGYVSEIASSENYIVRYGTVMTKNPTSVMVQYEDGSQQLLPIDGDTVITKENRIVTYSSVQPGSKVKMVIHRTDQSTVLKELALEIGNYYISNIYKASIYYYDPYNSNLIVNNLKKLERGQWTLTPYKGDVDIELDENVSVYAGGKLMKLEDINKYYTDREVYIAVEKGLGGKEKAVLLNMRNTDEPERRYEDTIKYVVAGTGEFIMNNRYETFKYTEGTIIIKNGKLITGNNLDINDKAYVVVNRGYDSGEYNAGIIEVQEQQTDDTIVVYRGRIKSINEQQDFTVESFSQLRESGGRLRWTYYNTPKTFMITGKTRILDENGVVNNREFDEYSDRQYVGKIVNIVADGLEAVMITEAPYGVHNLRGEVYLKYGQKADGTLALRKVSIYDRSDGEWEDADDADITLREDTIILKNNQPVKPSQIVRGNVVKILKTDDEPSGDALVIIIEE